jgi:nitrite reductase/ring-hydroxylating ferredoxin subunit
MAETVMGDWRAQALARVRRLIGEALPEATEEVKWRKPSTPEGVPVWESDGIVCTGETYKDKVKLTFAHGAALPDRRACSTPASTAAPAAQSICARGTNWTRMRGRRGPRGGQVQRGETEKGKEMSWIRVATAAEIPPGKIAPIKAEGRKLLLANVGGKFHAAGRKCPHLGFNLCRGGKLDGQAIVCPLHKAKFDLETGRIERDPKLLFLKMTAKTDLPIYPVRVEGGDVLVEVT